VKSIVPASKTTPLATFLETYERKWTGRTECRSRHMVRDSKEFKAPKTSATTGGG
jgi:hypothetical protein